MIFVGIIRQLPVTPSRISCTKALARRRQHDQVYCRACEMRRNRGSIFPNVPPKSFGGDVCLVHGSTMRVNFACAQTTPAGELQAIVSYPCPEKRLTKVKSLLVDTSPRRKRAYVAGVGRSWQCGSELTLRLLPTMCWRFVLAWARCILFLQAIVAPNGPQVITCIR